MANCADPDGTAHYEHNIASVVVWVYRAETVKSDAVI